MALTNEVFSADFYASNHNRRSLDPELATELADEEAELAGE